MSTKIKWPAHAYGTIRFDNMKIHDMMGCICVKRRPKMREESGRSVESKVKERKMAQQTVQREALLGNPSKNQMVEKLDQRKINCVVVEELNDA